MERVVGNDPTSLRWQRSALPLCYTRIVWNCVRVPPPIIQVCNLTPLLSGSHSITNVLYLGAFHCLIDEIAMIMRKHLCQKVAPEHFMRTGIERRLRTGVAQCSQPIRPFKYLRRIRCHCQAFLTTKSKSSRFLSGHAFHRTVPELRTMRRLSDELFRASLRHQPVRSTIRPYRKADDNNRSNSRVQPHNLAWLRKEPDNQLTYSQGLIHCVRFLPFPSHLCTSRYVVVG